MNNCQKYILCKIKKYLTFLLTCLWYTAYAQNHSLIDSLKHQLLHEVDSKTKTNLYIEIANGYKSENSELVEVYADSAIYLAESINYTQAKVDALNIKAYINHISGNLEKALLLNDEIIRLSKEIKYKKGEANAILNISRIFFIKGEFKKSLLECETALKLAKEIDDHDILVEVYNSLANNYSGLGILKKSLEYRHLVLQLYKETGNRRGLALTYMNLGVFYYYENNYKKALFNYKKAAEVYDDNMQSEKAVNLNNIALVYEKTNRLDSAQKYYKECIVIGEKLKFGRLLGWAYNGKGIVLQKLGNLKEAKILLDKALAQRRALGDNFEIANTYLAIGDNFKLTNNTQQAINYYQKAERLSKNGNIVYRRDALQKLHETYNEEGDFLNAYKYQSEYYLLKDSLQNEDVTKQITLLEAEFNFEKERDSLKVQNRIKDIALKSSQREQTYTRNVNFFLLLSIIVILCFLGIGIRDKKIKGKLNEQLSKQSKELKELNSKKNRLFTIISHDLKAPINRVFGLVNLLRNNLLEESEKEIMINEIDKNAIGVNTLLNNLLSWISFEEGKLSLKAEEINLANRVQSIINWIEPATKPKNISITKEISEEHFIKSDPNSFDLIVRNLLSNAIKFVNKNGKVIIRSKMVDSNIEIEVNDNGVGMSKEKVSQLFNESRNKSSLGTIGEKGTGLGLNLVKEHVKMNGGSIRVESEVNVGTTFFIVLKKYE